MLECHVQTLCIEVEGSIEIYCKREILWIEENVNETTGIGRWCSVPHTYPGH